MRGRVSAITKWFDTMAHWIRKWLSGRHTSKGVAKADVASRFDAVQATHCPQQDDAGKQKEQAATRHHISLRNSRDALNGVKGKEGVSGWGAGKAGSQLEHKTEKESRVEPGMACRRSGRAKVHPSYGEFWGYARTSERVLFARAKEKRHGGRFDRLTGRV